MMRKIQKKGRPVRPAWTAQAICASISNTPITGILAAPPRRRSIAWGRRQENNARSERPARRVANDVEEGLPTLLGHHLDGASERLRQLGRVLDPDAIAAGGGADFLEGGEVVEADEGRMIALRRLAAL